MEFGTLYLVATPIGNLEDITYRAVRILSEADVIAAEDTRHTLKLLNHLGIKKPLISYHDNNRLTRAAELLDKLRSGQSIALVSDAGTPAISDPGEELVAMAIAEGFTVSPIPGCSAAVTALICSGLSTERFAFEGFLPQKHNERVKKLEAIKGEERTLIFYEGPHRIKETLKDMVQVFGQRKAVAARELTKLHEEFVRDTLDGLLGHFQAQDPRGEFVLIVEGGPAPTAKEAQAQWESVSIKDHVEGYVKKGYDRMEAMKMAAKDRGISKRQVYAVLNGEGRSTP